MRNSDYDSVTVGAGTDSEKKIKVLGFAALEKEIQDEYKQVKIDVLEDGTFVLNTHTQYNDEEPIEYTMWLSEETISMMMSTMMLLAELKKFDYLQVEQCVINNEIKPVLSMNYYKELEQKND